MILQTILYTWEFWLILALLIFIIAWFYSNVFSPDSKGCSGPERESRPGEKGNVSSLCVRCKTTIGENTDHKTIESGSDDHRRGRHFISSEEKSETDSLIRSLLEALRFSEERQRERISPSQDISQGTINSSGEANTHSTSFTARTSRDSGRDTRSVSRPVSSSSVGSLVTAEDSSLLSLKETSSSRQQHTPFFTSRESTAAESEQDSKNSYETIDLTPELPKNFRPNDRSLSPGSRPEEECRRVLEKIYRKPFPKKRPEWLVNDLTGRCLELDGYNATLGIAFEYNSEYHYKSSHRFNGSDKAFRDLVYRDSLKIDLCDKNGVYLITVPYHVRFEDIEKYIISQLPENLKRNERLGELTSESSDYTDRSSSSSQ